MAEAVAEVLKQRFKRLESPCGANVFFDLRCVAQCAPGGVGGLFGREACLLLFFRFQFQVAAQLAFKVSFALLPPMPREPEF